MDKNLVKKGIYLFVVFLFFYFAPLQSDRIKSAFYESLFMMQEYAREHVILCLIPAILIAGAISAFMSKESVLKYLGAKTNKFLSFSVASVSGTILAVCSCTVLPLFAGIFYRGAGIGPAIAFLFLLLCNFKFSIFNLQLNIRRMFLFRSHLKYLLENLKMSQISLIYTMA